MTRWFNIAGPCSDDIHYMLSPTVRLPDLEELIQQLVILFFTHHDKRGKPPLCYP